MELLHLAPVASVPMIREFFAEHWDDPESEPPQPNDEWYCALDELGGAVMPTIPRIGKRAVRPRCEQASAPFPVEGHPLDDAERDRRLGHLPG